MFSCNFMHLTAAIILLGIASVQSIPVQRMVRSSLSSSSTTDPPVIISEEIRTDLVNITYESRGLFPVWLNAIYLAKENILKAQYQRWEQKVCRGRVFNINASKDSCSNKDSKNLTYSQLTAYYNELVVQLRLAAQHNLNVSIPLEVKEENLTESLKREEQIIKLLNESILPALETTLNISTDNTNCSATEVLVNHMISLYTNCAAVQTSNTFLAQTLLSLFGILDDKKVDSDPNINSDVKTPDNKKKWCIV